jgi:hypothetical protein
LTQQAHLIYSQGLILSDLRSSGKPLVASNDGVVTGSPYLNDEWNTGYVYVNDKIKSDNILIRYDIYSDAIEMQEGKNTYILDPSKIKGFKYKVNITSGYIEYHFRNGFSQIKSVTGAAYFEILFEGKNTFLKRYTKKLAYDASSYGSASNRSFQDQSMFYVIKQSGEIIELTESKKSLLRAFPQQEKEISSFIKSHSIKISNSEDMKTVFKFVDSII